MTNITLINNLPDAVVVAESGGAGDGDGKPRVLAVMPRGLIRIRLYQLRADLAGAPPQEFEAESLALWLLDHYGTQPRVPVQIFRGEPSAETEITADIKAILRAEAPVYTVLESPGTAYPIVNMIISMVVSAAINNIFAPNRLNNPNTNRAQESPNNQLANRENRIRVMERVEDIYGTVRAIPSLMMPTYFKYIANRKVEYGYYCIGRGYHDIADVRDGDTLLSSISGASAAVYAPFTSPNSGSPQLLIGDPIIDPIVTVSRSGSVDGILLKPMNQIQLQAGMAYDLYGPGEGGPDISGEDRPISATEDTVYQRNDDRKPNFAAIAEVGQTMSLSMAPAAKTRVGTVTAAAADNSYTLAAGAFTGIVIGSDVDVAGMSTADNNGVRTVVSVSADGSKIVVSGGLPLTDDTTAGVAVDVMVDFSFTGRTISSVGSGYVTLSGTPEFAWLDAYTADAEVDNGASDWTDWFTLPDTDRTEVWTNVLAMNGMYKDDGAKQSATVAYELQIEQLDSGLVPTGTVETVSGSITGATSNERAETLEQTTGWVGPARVRARRTTPFDYDFTGLVNDEIQWVDLYSVTPVPAGTYPHFGNKTTIHTVTMANSRATSVRRRELNCLASRKLPIYIGEGAFSGAFNAEGFLTSGTIAATSRILDIIPAITIDPQIGNRSISELDIANLVETQIALDAWNTACGQFNYTFDTDSISYEETVTAIANAAFCTPYRQNGKIRLALDRPQADAVALFTHRNKRPNAETITRSFANDGEYDGVEFAYIDPDTESQETIRLPLDGSYTKLKKIEIPGIRDFTQAWFRANRELNRIKHQRISIETETTTDARALLPNSRILVVDSTRFKSWDGEVVAQDGLTLTLSRDVEFLPATPHSIVLMKRDGSLESIACTEVSGHPNKVLLAGAPAEAIVTSMTPEDGIRTIFSFAADSARAAQAYLVQEIGISDGRYIRLSAINYSDEYYAADEEAIPAKEGVIN